MSRPRTWSGWSAVTAAIVAVACGTTEAPLPPLQAGAAPNPPSRWPRLEEVRAWPEAGDPFASRGHGLGANYSARVRVTPHDLAAYRGVVAGCEFADGAGIAMFHTDAAGRAGSVFVMEKRGGAWSFVATDGSGILLDGDLGLCARCHEDGTADHVFGNALSPARVAPP